jgi:hypothetical protein
MVIIGNMANGNDIEEYALIQRPSQNTVGFLLRRYKRDAEPAYVLA